MSDHLGELLRPSNIAVIGASADEQKWGNRLVRNTVALGFQGPLWAVNPRRDPKIDGGIHVASVADIDAVVDLAIAAVPRTSVLELVRDCAERGVRNLVVPASGFGETGDEGASEELAILEIAQDSGMRVLGPNCFGLFSAGGAFNATPFTPIPAGDVALVSQSGNVAGHAFFAASRRSMGFSHVIGLGNQLDISFAEVVNWLSQDDETRRVALYLEGLRDIDAGAFLQSVARCRDAGKTVVIIKSGGSEAGRAVALSHTGSLATEDRVWQQVLMSAGAIRVHSMDDMFGVLALACSLRPRGREVAVMTDGGGDSIMAVDGVERHGLVLAEFPEQVQTRLDKVIPPAAPRIEGRNPITLDTAGGVDDDPEIIPRCLEVLEGEGGFDIVVVGGLYGTYEHVRDKELRAAEKIVGIVKRGLRVAVHSPIPVEHSAPLKVLQESGVPVFEDMDRLLKALALWLPASRTLHTPTIGDVSEPQANAPMQWAPEDAHSLMTTAGALLPPQFVVTNEVELENAATEIGYPICIKTAAPHIVHKSDVGGVRVGLGNWSQLHSAARQMIDDTGSSRLLAMPSLLPGTEIMMGARFSSQFGVVLVVGRGGIWTEMEADTVTFVNEVAEGQFVDAMRQLRCAPMLFGGRGQASLDVSSLADLAKAVMDVVRERQDINVDLNPVFLYQNGYSVADLRVVREQVNKPQSTDGAGS